ncbi:MAG: ATP-binding cassette domain-containing protein [Actinobacteria bacterium]|nr:ATP-binding cassette domain-containing protein [Actinomycetota bacterium]
MRNYHSPARRRRNAVAAGHTGRVCAGEPLFAFEAVSVGPPEARRLAGLDAQLPGGGLTVVAGPSGSGKSTLLRLCNRLDVPSEGRVRHRGEDIAQRDPLRLRREVAMVFQRPVTFAGTVLDNLREADPGCDEARGAELLERAGLPATFLARDAGELSGGEAQRACLARALATDPHVMLMDEPTSALDAKATAVLERLASQLVRDGTPVVWVSHSEAQMRRLADFVLLLDGGRVDREGSAQEVLGVG